MQEVYRPGAQRTPAFRNHGRRPSSAPVIKPRISVQVISEMLHEGTHSRSLLDCSYKLLRRGSGDVVPSGATQDRSGNGVKFRNPALFHVFLHGTAHLRRHLAKTQDDGIRVNSRAFSRRNGTGLLYAERPKLVPGRIT